MTQSDTDLNLVQFFLSRTRRYGYRDALRYKCQPGGDYAGISWHQWAEFVEKTALGLYALGIRHGDRVAILSENRPEWTYADLGILSLGAITVPGYPSLTAPDIRYLVEHAQVKAIFVSSEEQLEKVLPLIKSCEHLHHLITFDPIAKKLEKGLLTLEDLLQKGRVAALNNENLYAKTVSGVHPDDLATIIYTSGTTGPPKGVMLSHRNFLANCQGAERMIQIREEDVAISFLPLSHVFERLAGYYFMLGHGAVITYAESMQTVAQDVLIVKPTVAAAVPRFYEKVYTRLMEKVEQGPRWRKKLFSWAIGVAALVGPKKMKREPISGFLFLKYKIADLLVFKKLRKALGGRIRFFISGGAPLSRPLAEFFYGAGVMILEGYGLTETSPVISVNSLEHFRFGTVGQVLENVEVKIAADGEILTKGPCVMKGYFRDDNATLAVLKDGWFYTGDIGEVDPEGFLKTTDRKKDLIVTSGGKNVAPQNIEKLILADALFSQVVVIGDKRPYLVALLVLHSDSVKRFAQERHLSGSYEDTLLKHPEIYAWIESRLRERTGHLASYEQIKYFAILKQELSQDAGELTPTLKVKRKVIMEKYHDLLESLYIKGLQKQAH